MLVKTILKNSAKAALAITAAPQHSLAFADVATLSRGVGESCSLSKKVAKR
jgi:hypothetical protein